MMELWVKLNNQQKAGVALGLLLLLVFGGYMALRPPPAVVFQEADALQAAPAEPMEPIAPAVAVKETAAEPAPTELAIHVAGKVKTPGLYKLPPGSRVDDAIKAAGGSLPGADLESINLAAKLEDGKQLYVPAKQKPNASPEAAFRPLPRSDPAFVPDRLAPMPTPAPGDGKARVVEVASREGQAGGGKLREPGDGKVRLNSAGLEELQRLPGVGPSTAQKIVDYRKEKGRFSAIEELLDVSGIGPKKYEKMRPFLAL